MEQDVCIQAIASKHQTVIQPFVHSVFSAVEGASDTEWRLRHLLLQQSTWRGGTSCCCCCCCCCCWAVDVINLPGQLLVRVRSGVRVADERQTNNASRLVRTTTSASASVWDAGRLSHGCRVESCEAQWTVRNNAKLAMLCTLAWRYIGQVPKRVALFILMLQIR